MPSEIVQIVGQNSEAKQLHDAAKTGDFEAARRLGEMCGEGVWEACAYMTDDLLQMLENAGVDVPLYAGSKGGQLNDYQVTTVLGEDLFEALFAEPLRIPPQAFMRTIHAAQEALVRADQLGIASSIPLEDLLNIQSVYTELMTQLAAGATSGSYWSAYVEQPWEWKTLKEIWENSIPPLVTTETPQAAQAMRQIGWVETKPPQQLTPKIAGQEVFWTWPGPLFRPQPGNVPGMELAVEEAAEFDPIEFEPEAAPQEEPALAPQEEMAAQAPAKVPAPVAIGGLAIGAWLARKLLLGA